jgi:hypothetical protein
MAILIIMIERITFLMAYIIMVDFLEMGIIIMGIRGSEEDTTITMGIDTTMVDAIRLETVDTATIAIENIINDLIAIEQNKNV